MNLDASSQKAPVPSKASPKYISYDEVQKHNSPESCWVIINGQVYDATSVLAWHPGGAAVILKNAGKDATYVSLPIPLSTQSRFFLLGRHLCPCIRRTRCSTYLRKPT